MSKKIEDTSKNPMLGWLFGGNPRAIEDQEARGQEELVDSDQLPAKINEYGRNTSAISQYKKWGVKVVGEESDDNLFVDVILPEGWEKRPTDHSMWSELYDDKGRVRASIFYKAAFYDRDAFININKRYYWSSDYKDDNTISHFVFDNGTGERLFETETVEKDYYKTEEGTRRNEDLQNQCKKFLKKNFRKHEDVNAYWD